MSLFASADDLPPIRPIPPPSLCQVIIARQWWTLGLWLVVVSVDNARPFARIGLKREFRPACDLAIRWTKQAMLERWIDGRQDWREMWRL